MLHEIYHAKTRSALALSDIRIGIKFNPLGGTETYTVHDISDNTQRGKIKFDSDRYSHIVTIEESTAKFWLMEMAGIPLSPEWLTSGGFIRHSTDPDTWIIPDSNHQVVLKNGSWIYRIPGLSLREISFVHELQNLFFALTGRELVFKRQQA